MYMTDRELVNARIDAAIGVLRVELKVKHCYACLRKVEKLTEEIDHLKALCKRYYDELDVPN